MTDSMPSYEAMLKGLPRTRTSQWSQWFDTLVPGEVVLIELKERQASGVISALRTFLFNSGHDHEVLVDRQGDSIYAVRLSPEDAIERATAQAEGDTEQNEE